MSSRPSPFPLDSNAYWEVSDAAVRLTKQACTSSARLLRDGRLRMQFNREFAYYAKRVVDDVALGKKTPEQGLSELTQTLRRLSTKTIDLAVKGVGVAAGVAQIATEVGICYASVGTLCVVAGVPLMAHGANNIYENGRNILEGRSNVEGPIRRGYQSVSEALGGTTSHGNVAYASIDTGLSIYSLLMLVIKPGTWRLFHHLPSDYVRAYKTVGVVPLLMEVHSNSQNAYQIQKELRQ
jgi:hypothetical protein